MRTKVRKVIEAKKRIVAIRVKVETLRKRTLHDMWELGGQLIGLRKQIVAEKGTLYGHWGEALELMGLDRKTANRWINIKLGHRTKKDLLERCGTAGEMRTLVQSQPGDDELDADEFADAPSAKVGELSHHETIQTNEPQPNAAPSASGDRADPVLNKHEDRPSDAVDGEFEEVAAPGKAGASDAPAETVAPDATVSKEPSFDPGLPDAEQEAVVPDGVKARRSGLDSTYADKGERELEYTIGLMKRGELERHLREATIAKWEMGVLIGHLTNRLNAVLDDGGGED